MNQWQPDNIPNGWWPSVIINQDLIYVTWGNQECYFAAFRLAQHSGDFLQQGNTYKFTGNQYGGQFVSPIEFYTKKEISKDNWTVLSFNIEQQLWRTIIEHVTQNDFVAADNHYGIYTAGPYFTINYDEQIIANQCGGAISIGGNVLCHRSTNQDDTKILLYINSVLYDNFIPNASVHQSSVNKFGDVIYGGYGPIWFYGKLQHKQVNVARFETIGCSWIENGESWIATLYEETNEVKGIAIREAGSKSFINITCNATFVNVIPYNDYYIVVSNDNVGKLTVYSIRKDTKQVTIDELLPNEQYNRKILFSPYKAYTNAYGPTQRFIGNTYGPIEEAHWLKELPGPFMQQLKGYDSAYDNPTLCYYVHTNNFDNAKQEYEIVAGLPEKAIILYYDEPTEWPQVPSYVKRNRTWWGLQAYISRHNLNETIEEFENRIRYNLDRLEPGYVSLTAQAYTMSGAVSLDKVLKMFPVYHRLLTDYNKIISFQPFADMRPSGMVTHSVLYDECQKIYNRIIGRPTRYEYWVPDSNNNPLSKEQLTIDINGNTLIRIQQDYLINLLP